MLLKKAEITISELFHNNHALNILRIINSLFVVSSDSLRTRAATGAFFNTIHQEPTWRGY
jgi:hypothetical protein